MTEVVQTASRQVGAAMLWRYASAGVLAVAVETIGFWWTTGATPAPAVVAAHGVVVVLGATILGSLVLARGLEHVAARIWIVGLPCLPLGAILLRLVGPLALWVVAIFVVVLAIFVPRRQRESVVIGGVAGMLLAARLGFFAVREYAGRETDGQVLFTIAGLAVVAIGAYVIVPRWFPRPVLSTVGRAALLVAVTVSATALAVAAGQPHIPDTLAGSASSRTHPPVVLVVLDTVRADHLSLYGYPQDTMPGLTAFAREEAVVVDRPITNAPDSLSAHASLFTGRFPVNHGAHRPTLDDPDPPQFGYALDSSVPTLAERLSRQGYTTLGVSGNFGPVSRELGLGLDRGFQVYRSRPDVACQFVRQSPWRPVVRFVNATGTITWLSRCRVRYRTADQVTDDAVALVDRVGDSSFFLFVNYMDAHDPYAPPAQFVAPPSPETSPSPVARYDGELRFLDSHLVRLIERLRQHPSWDEMLMVITSDHGEAFGEHDLVGHTSALYDVMIRVPLVLKFPAPGTGVGAPLAGTRLARTMQLVDIAPVVLAHVGIQGTQGMDGRRLDEAPAPLRAWSYPSMVMREADDQYSRELRSIEEGVWKLIEDDRGRMELYDLQSDPSEIVNLAGQETGRVETMRAQLGPRLVEAPREPSELSEESLDRLRSLGYVR